MLFGHSNRTKFLMARVASRANTTSSLMFLLTFVWAATGPAWTQESDGPFGFFDRMFSGSERMGGGGGGERASTERTAQMAGPDVVVRLDRLEAQIRQLTGVIEQLQFRNQQLEGQLRRMYDDNEHRFQELGGKGSPRPAAQPRSHNLPAASTPAANPARRGDAFDPAQHPNAPGVPQTLGSMGAGSVPPPGSPAVGEASIGAPGGRGASSPLDLATMSPPPGQQQTPRMPNPTGALATLPPSQTPRDEYDLAYGYLLRKDYALAEDSFRSFLSRYPNDRLTGDATYWFGESLFQRQRFRDAAEAFLNVSTKFESASRAPDALLRLGQSLAALGEKEAACASLGEVLRKFPRASAAVKQGVDREQKRVRC
jgi:tol-pal system protein YbgF